MAQDITNSDFVLGTTVPVKPRDYISILVEDEFGNKPFELYQGQSITITKTDPIDGDTILLQGLVPDIDPPDAEYDPNGRTWLCRIQVDIEQIPPVPLAPTIDLVAPDEVSTSSLITIIGARFSNTLLDNIVTIDGEPVTVISASAMRLECQCPPIAAGVDLPVVVTVNGLSSTTFPTNEDAKVDYIAPRIDALEPNPQRVSGQLQIIGDFFSDILGEIISVDFTGSASSAVILSADTEVVVVEVPADAQTGPVTITTGSIAVNNTGSSSPIDFAVALHTITATVPAFTVARGEGFAIAGTNFSDYIADHTVTIGGALATLTVAGEIELQTVVPMGAALGAQLVSVTLNGNAVTFPITITV